jgi:hypothetical protein
MAFRQRGYRILTDDICVIRDGQIQPGFPQAKLWLDSLEELQIPSEGLQKIRTKLEKRSYPFGDTFAAAALPPRKIYLLSPAATTTFKIEPIQGVDKFTVLREQTYRFAFIAKMETKARHFQSAMKLAQDVPVAIVSRPSDRFRLAELVALLEADFSSASASGSASAPASSSSPSADPRHGASVSGSQTP